MTSEQPVTVTVLDSTSADAAAIAESASARRFAGAPPGELTAAIWAGATTVVVDDVAAAQRIVDLVLDVMASRQAQ